MLLSESYRNRLRVLAGLLNEATSDEIHGKYYKDIPKDVFDQIISSDPTSRVDKRKMGIYSKWLLKLFKGGNLKLEDLYKATDYLTLFHNNKNTLKLRNKNIDINQYKSLPHLFDTVQKFRTGSKPDVENVEDETELLDNTYYLDSGEAEKVYEDNEWAIFVPKTLEASQFYGCASEWCTLFPREFDSYSSRGKLYILINKNNLNSDNLNRRLQFHFEEGQFMNLFDEHIDLLRFVANNPAVVKFFFKERENDIKFDDFKIINGIPFIIVSDWSYFSKCFKENRNSLSREFIQDVLDGDGFQYFEIYEDIDTSYAMYFVDDINDSNFKKIKEYLSEDKVEVNSLSELENLLKDGGADEILSAIKLAVNLAQEQANSDEAYETIRKAIFKHFEIIDYKWQGDKLIIKIPVHIASMAPFIVHKSFIEGFCNEENGGEYINVDRPYGGFNGDITSESFNDNLSYQLEDL